MFDRGTSRSDRQLRAQIAALVMISLRWGRPSAVWISSRPADPDGLEKVYETLTCSDDASFMRFTEVRRIDDSLEVIWSYATDGQPAMTRERLDEYLNQIPRLDDNQRVTLVEAYTYDRPFFNVGLEDRIIPSFVPISQRYAARLAFAPGNETDPGDGSVIANDTDCGPSVTEVNGLPLIGAGNCEAEGT